MPRQLDVRALQEQLKAKEFKKVVAQIEEHLTTDASNYNAHLLLGAALEGQHLYPEAIVIFTKSILLTDDPILALKGLCKVYACTSEHTKFIETGKQLIRLYQERNDKEKECEMALKVIERLWQVKSLNHALDMLCSLPSDHTFFLADRLLLAEKLFRLFSAEKLSHSNLENLLHHLYVEHLRVVDNRVDIVERFAKHAKGNESLCRLFFDTPECLSTITPTGWLLVTDAYLCFDWTRERYLSTFRVFIAHVMTDVPSTSSVGSLSSPQLGYRYYSLSIVANTNIEREQLQMSAKTHLSLSPEDHLFSQLVYASLLYQMADYEGSLRVITDRIDKFIQPSISASYLARLLTYLKALNVIASNAKLNNDPASALSLSSNASPLIAYLSQHRLGYYHFQHGEFAQSVAVYDSLLDQYPTDPPSLSQKAWLLWTTNNSSLSKKMTIDISHSAIDTRDHFQSISSDTNASVALDLLQKALSLATSIKSTPSSSSAIDTPPLIYCAYASNDEQGRHVVYTQDIQSDSHLLSTIHERMALIYYSNDATLSLSFSHFLDAVQFNPCAAFSWLHLGHLYRQQREQNQDEEQGLQANLRAKKCYLRALTLDSSLSAEAGPPLYQLLIDMNETDQAIELLQHLVPLEDGVEEKDPQQQQRKEKNVVSSHGFSTQRWSLKNTAWAWRKLGDHAMIAATKQQPSLEACRCYRMALKVDYLDATLWVSLAKAYLTLGQYSAALKSFRRAESLSPLDRSASVCCAQLERWMGLFRDSHRRLVSHVNETVGTVNAWIHAELSCTCEGWMQDAWMYDGNVTLGCTLWMQAMDHTLLALAGLSSTLPCLSLYKRLGDLCYVMATDHHVSVNPSVILRLNERIETLFSQSLWHSDDPIHQLMNDQLGEISHKQPTVTVSQWCISVAVRAYRRKLHHLLVSSSSQHRHREALASAFYDLGIALSLESHDESFQKAYRSLQLSLSYRAHARTWTALGALFLYQHRQKESGVAMATPLSLENASDFYLSQHCLVKATQCPSEEVREDTWLLLSLLYGHFSMLTASAQNALERAHLSDSDAVLPWIAHTLNQPIFNTDTVKQLLQLEQQHPLGHLLCALAWLSDTRRHHDPSSLSSIIRLSSYLSIEKENNVSNHHQKAMMLPFSLLLAVYLCSHTRWDEAEHLLSSLDTNETSVLPTELHQSCLQFISLLRNHVSFQKGGDLIDTKREKSIIVQFPPLLEVCLGMKAVQEKQSIETALSHFKRAYEQRPHDVFPLIAQFMYQTGGQEEKQRAIQLTQSKYTALSKENDTEHQKLQFDLLLHLVAMLMDQQQDALVHQTLVSARQTLAQGFSQGKTTTSTHSCDSLASPSLETWIRLDRLEYLMYRSRGKDIEAQRVCEKASFLHGHNVSESTFGKKVSREIHLKDKGYFWQYVSLNDIVSLEKRLFLTPYEMFSSVSLNIEMAETLKRALIDDKIRRRPFNRSFWLLIKQCLERAEMLHKRQEMKNEDERHNHPECHPIVVHLKILEVEWIMLSQDSDVERDLSIEKRSSEVIKQLKDALVCADAREENNTQRISLRKCLARYDFYQSRQQTLSAKDRQALLKQSISLYKQIIEEEPLNVVHRVELCHLYRHASEMNGSVLENTAYEEALATTANSSVSGPSRSYIVTCYLVYFIRQTLASLSMNDGDDVEKVESHNFDTVNRALVSQCINELLASRHLSASMCATGRFARGWLTMLELSQLDKPRNTQKEEKKHESLSYSCRFIKIMYEACRQSDWQPQERESMVAKAMKGFHGCLEKQKDYPKAHLMLAVLYLLKGDSILAEKHLDNERNRLCLQEGDDSWLNLIHQLSDLTIASKK